MTQSPMPHSGHDRHLCYLANLGFQNNHPQEYKALVENPQFLCRNCGRVATSEENLCNPEKL